MALIRVKTLARTMSRDAARRAGRDVVGLALGDPCGDLGVGQTGATMVIGVMLFAQALIG